MAAGAAYALSPEVRGAVNSAAKSVGTHAKNTAHKAKLVTTSNKVVGNYAKPGAGYANPTRLKSYGVPATKVLPGK